MALLHLSLCCFILSAISGVFADLAPFLSDDNFDKGSYGQYPSQTFVSSDLSAPRPNILQHSVECEDDLFLFLAPRGNAVASAPMILDPQLNLVWSSKGYGNVYNLRMQEYEGAQVLTFWSGDDSVRGHGSGDYYTLDSSYQEVHKISAGNGLPGDLHEFLLTDEGTALLTIYEPTTADLSSVGRSTDSYIYDSLFQEIDLHTREALFQWRASDHYSFTETYRDLNGEGSRSKRWDWFHINSVEKDSAGNYLVSARYTHTVSYIDGRTGEVIWTLGGRRGDFLDLSGGKATNFAAQHDARWVEALDQTSADGRLFRRGMTLFDNGGDYDMQVAEESRGLKIALDLEMMTAELITEYFNPAKALSFSQGNLQSLPSGNVLLGYGFNGMLAEFSSDGELLCDVHFQPSSAVNTGNVQSYRVLKQPWIGRPASRPDLAVSDGKAFVSWNGATEVRSWMLQASDDCEGDESGFHNVTEHSKTGFETTLSLDHAMIPEAWIRVVALDSNGEELGTSAFAELSATSGFLSPGMAKMLKAVRIAVLVELAVYGLVVMLFIVLYVVSRLLKRSRKGRHDGHRYTLLA